MLNPNTRDQTSMMSTFWIKSVSLSLVKMHGAGEHGASGENGPLLVLVRRPVAKLEIRDIKQENEIVWSMVCPLVLSAVCQLMMKESIQWILTRKNIPLQTELIEWLNLIRK